VQWTLTFDCHDARRVAAFWALALGYVQAPPPTGWATWQDWLRDFDVPEDEWDDGAALVDPDGLQPRISFLRVPEPKQVKNRIHLDLQVSGGRHVEQSMRERAIRDTVDRLVAAGGEVLVESPEAGPLDHVVMCDPEGAEFCVV
jgi:Glyoxalase-like domain